MVVKSGQIAQGILNLGLRGRESVHGGGKAAEIVALAARRNRFTSADVLFPRPVRGGCCSTSKAKAAAAPKTFDTKDISLARKFPIRTMSCCPVGAGQHDRRRGRVRQLASRLQVKGTVFLQDDLSGPIEEAKEPND